MKRTTLQYALSAGLGSMLALGATSSFVDVRRGADAASQATQYCAPPEQNSDSAGAPKIYCHDGQRPAVVHSSDHRVAAGGSDHGTAFAVADKVDPDPTGGRSIIIECVVLGDRVTANPRGAEDAWNMHSASVPRYDLGPSKCWPNEYDEIAIATAAEVS